MKTRSEITKELLRIRKPINFYDLDVLDKLLSNVRLNDKGCWIRGLDSSLYTRINVFGETRLAHRFSYEIYTGRKLQHLACHKCDVKACINPDHIFDGTDSDNMRDARIKRKVFSIQLDNSSSEAFELVLDLEGRMRKLMDK